MQLNTTTSPRRGSSLRYQRGIEVRCYPAETQGLSHTSLSFLDSLSCPTINQAYLKKPCEEWPNWEHQKHQMLQSLGQLEAFVGWITGGDRGFIQDEAALIWGSISPRSRAMLKVIAAITAEPEPSAPGVWIELIRDCCQRRDKHRLRDVLDGLRADETLDQPQRRGIWVALDVDERAMCQAIASVAGGESNG